VPFDACGDCLKVLLYGFGPFLDLKENPSERVVRALDGKKVKGNEVVGIVLPVEYGRAASLLSAKMREIGPGLVLGTGAYRSFPKLGVTKLAANFKFTLEKDNAGESPKGERIVEGGPDGIFMNIDSEGLVAHLNAAGVPAMLILSAPDAYVCNLSMFVVAAQSRKDGFRCGFIHLPLTEEFVSKNPSIVSASMGLSTMLRGVEAAIGYCAAAHRG